MGHVECKWRKKLKLGGRGGGWHEWLNHAEGGKI